MNQQQTSVEVRRRRNQEESAQLAADFERSGQTRIEFSRQHGLSVGTLDLYRKRHGQSRHALLPPSQLIPVELAFAAPASSSGLAVAMPNGYRIEVGREFDAHTLRLLVALLGRS